MRNICEVCESPSKSKCSRCKMVLYCSRECQIDDHDEHKHSCLLVKKAQSLVEKEEARLRSMPPSAFLPPNVFERCVGNFWGVHETRNYMRARMSHAQALVSMATELSLKDAVCQMIDMLRLCTQDNMGVRSLVPGVYLCQRNREQECYNFIKFWFTEDTSSFAWGTRQPPHCDLLEPVFPELLSARGDFNLFVAAALIKIRLYIKMRNFTTSWYAFLSGTHARLGCDSPIRLICGASDNAILRLVRDYAWTGSPWLDEATVYSQGGPSALTSILCGQVGELLDAGEKHNNRIWKAFVNPTPVYKSTPPSGYSMGSFEEVILVVKSLFDAFEFEDDDGEVMELLEARVGPNPTYDCSLFML